MWTVCVSSFMQRYTLTRSSRATCWWTREVRMVPSSTATESYRSTFCVSFFSLFFFASELSVKLPTSSMHTRFIVCSPKPSVSHMHWRTVMRWRWERLCCPFTSTQGPTPVMAASPVRWWLTSASTGERRLQVSHTKRKHIHGPFFFWYMFLKQLWITESKCLKSLIYSIPQTKALCEIAFTGRGCLPFNMSSIIVLDLPLLSLYFPKGPVLTKEDKEALRQKELKQMKAKYGLQVSVIRTSCSQF